MEGMVGRQPAVPCGNVRPDALRPGAAGDGGRDDLPLCRRWNRRGAEARETPDANVDSLQNRPESEQNAVELQCCHTAQRFRNRRATAGNRQQATVSSRVGHLLRLRSVSTAYW